MTTRKQVPEPVRILVAKKISELLDEVGPDGKRLLTQGALGVKLGVSQEAARRAREPDGVTPAIVDGMVDAFSFVAPGSMSARIYTPGRQEARADRLSNVRAALLKKYSQAQVDEVIGGSEFLDGLNCSELEAYQRLEALILTIRADSKGKLIATPQPPHPKKPPKVGR